MISATTMRQMVCLSFVSVLLIFNAGCTVKGSASGDLPPLGTASGGGTPGTPTTDQSSPPAPEPQAVTLWKSYRATYTTLKKDGVAVCNNPQSDCLSVADRTSTYFSDEATGAAIPQIAAWNLLVSESSDGSTSYNVTVGIFADRGTYAFKNNVLTYDFEGPACVSGVGCSQLVEHLKLSPAPNGNILFQVEVGIAGQGLNSQFELKKVPGTELHDGPAGMTGGLVAVHEYGEGQGLSYQGLRCKISYTPNSAYIVAAELSMVVAGQEEEADGMLFKNDQGLLELVQQLGKSHGQETDAPNANSMDYYAAYGQQDGKLTEIPVSGSGIKNVTSDASVLLISQFEQTVGDICDRATNQMKKAK